MEKEMVQSLEWLEAQKIEISVDLFAAAKQHLHFLGVVDQNRWLYDGPMLERAVYRYNAYWLPLLAKYSESSPCSEGPFVPPLDCEWIWHCHRLNPARYKSDCEQLYGRVLDNYGTASSINGSCQLRTEKLWKILYPMEPYVLDLDKEIAKPEDFSTLQKCTTYDLVSAVKRQSSFFGKVSRAKVDDNNIMQEVFGRYKAFLYLNKRNREKSTGLFSVPTHDIDFMWHTHMLNPSSYYKDMEKIFGTILQHNDTDPDGSKRLKAGFSGTTAQWERTFGQMYWKANTETVSVKNAKCFGVATKKNSASCAACLSCGVKAVEKNGAPMSGCACACLAEEIEKNGAPMSGCACACLAEESKKNGAPMSGCACACLAEETEKNGAPMSGCACACLAEETEKNSAPMSGCACACLAEETEKNGAPMSGCACACLAEETEKNGALMSGCACACLAEETEKSVSCAACLSYGVNAVEKNGGCGIMIKNNDNENVLNNAVAA